MAWATRHRSVSPPRSSNRTCGFPASGSPTGFTARHTVDDQVRLVSRDDTVARQQPSLCGRVSLGGLRMLCGVAGLVANHRSSASSKSAPEVRVLSSAGITRPHQYYGPLRHPIAPRPTVTGPELVVTTDHAIGLPVLPALSWCTCCCHYPGAAPGLTLRSTTQTYQPSPKGSSGRPAHSRCHHCVTRYPKASATSSPP